MRYFPADDYDRKDVEELGAPEWMVNALRVNPAYCLWGPHEDYMIQKEGSDHGWATNIVVNSWPEFQWNPDDLNLFAHFYFQIRRDSKKCETCDGSGLNPATHQISEDFYDFEGRGTRWRDRITVDECQALLDNQRLHDFGKVTVATKELTEKVNEANRPGARGFGHDAINRWILIEARAKRLGVYGKCDACHGNGYLYTEPTPHLDLVLWVLHPRKGASRAAIVKDIKEHELPLAMEFLRKCKAEIDKVWSFGTKTAPGE